MKRQTLVFLVIILTSAGCGTTLIPPKRIPVDRVDYLDAINTSWKEQLLKNLVMLHHGDSLTFLELKSVTTQYNLATSLNAGYSYGLNLQAVKTAGEFLWVPTTNQNNAQVGANIAYGRTPSVCYAPIKGDNLRKTMMDPLPLDTVLKSLQAGCGGEYILPLTVESVNNLRSRSLEGKFPGDNDFLEFSGLFNELRNEGIIRINIGAVNEGTDANRPDEEPNTTAAKSGKVKKRAIKSAPPKSGETKPKQQKQDNGNTNYLTLDEGRAKSRGMEAKLNTFKELTGLTDPETKIKIICGNHKPDNKGELVIQPRSILQILALLSQCIVVTEDPIINNQDQNYTEPQAGNPPNNKKSSKNKITFKIIRSKERRDAFVSIRYHDYWFYIDEKDDHSKKLFSSMVLLLAMSEPDVK